MLENLADLIAAAEKEVADVTAAAEALQTAQGVLLEAQTAVVGAQTAVDEARSKVSTEKAEAVASLRAIVDEVNSAIEGLQAVPA